MAYRLAHTSDSHLCSDEASWNDLRDTLGAFLEAARDASVDLIVHAGDFFHARSGPHERTRLAEWLQRAAQIAPVFGVRGNHDAPGDLDIFNRLETRCSLSIRSYPTLPGEGSVLCDRTGQPRFGLLAAPWFDKCHLVAGLDATVDAERTRMMTNEGAERLLIGLRAEAARLREMGLIPVVVGHVMVAGSEMSTGQIIQGTTVELAPSALHEIGAEYVALGHVHKSQSWFNGRVAYSGSPIRQNFGEPEQKGWRLVTFDDDGKFLSNEFRPLPAQEIVLLETDWTSANLAQAGAAVGNPIDMGDLSLVRGARVRFRYRVNAADLHLVDEAVLRGILEQEGAADVKLEAVVEHEARVRNAEIVTAQTTAEKMLAYFDSNGGRPSDAVLERLAGRLIEIEREGEDATREQS
jgi:DNA repair protein SbcD/Mre11